MRALALAMTLFVCGSSALPVGAVFVAPQVTNRRVIVVDENSKRAACRALNVNGSVYLSLKDLGKALDAHVSKNGTEIQVVTRVSRGEMALQSPLGKQMDWTRVLVALAALYGAALSTYNLIRQSLERRPRLRVDLDYGLISQGPVVSEDQLILTARNSGNQPVVIVDSGLLFASKTCKANKASVRFRDPDCYVNGGMPHELQPRHHYKIIRNLRELATDMAANGYTGKAKIAAFFGDALDNRYVSKWRSFDAESWLRSSSDG